MNVRGHVTCYKTLGICYLTCYVPLGTCNTKGTSVKNDTMLKKGADLK